MGFKIIFAPEAIDRLSSIVKFIAQDNAEAAVSFGMKLVDHACLLADFPELGSLYPKRPNVRRLSCRPYLIYYRIKEKDKVIEILDFWHSARQDPELH
jgi:toxin ParE1/3/4